MQHIWVQSLYCLHVAESWQVMELWSWANLQMLCRMRWQRGAAADAMPAILLDGCSCLVALLSLQQEGYGCRALP